MLGLLVIGGAVAAWSAVLVADALINGTAPLAFLAVTWAIHFCIFYMSLKGNFNFVDELLQVLLSYAGFIVSREIRGTLDNTRCARVLGGTLGDEITESLRAISPEGIDFLLGGLLSLSSYADRML